MDTILCQSIDDFLNAYGDMVFRIALQHVQEDADAHDITQEVFIKIMKSHPYFESSKHERAWIIRVTLNLCNDHWRWIKRHLNIPLDEELVSKVDENKDFYLLHYVRKLNKNYRSAIYLFYYEEMSVKEIADLLDRKEKTILTWLRRVRLELKKELGVDYDER